MPGSVGFQGKNARWRVPPDLSWPGILLDNGGGNGPMVPPPGAPRGGVDPGRMFARCPGLVARMREMKLLVFAHTPPPVHGQSLMVERMIRCLGGDRQHVARTQSGEAASADPIEVFHVNARLSLDAGDIGHIRWGKLFALAGYCLQALGLMLQHGRMTLLYVPAPPKRAAVYRDWMVMALCRPFSRGVVLYWHAAGLGDWLEKDARPWERWVCRRLLGRVALSLVLSPSLGADAAHLSPRAIQVVANAIEDPCPDFDETIGPRRRERAAARKQAMENPHATTAAPADQREVRVLYLALCTRTKGLFDAAEGVIEANRRLRERGTPLTVTLSVAGAFSDPGEREEFARLAAGSGGTLRYLGFLDQRAKLAGLAAADLFCFPTYYANEGVPLALIEAMAFGLPVVTTRWRGIADYLPEGHLGVVEPRRPDQVATALLALLESDGRGLRGRYLQEFTVGRYLKSLTDALGAMAPPRAIP